MLLSYIYICPMSRGVRCLFCSPLFFLTPQKKRSQNIMSIDPSRIQLVLPPGGFPTRTVGVSNHRDATILGARGWAVGKGEKCWTNSLNSWAGNGNENLNVKFNNGKSFFFEGRSVFFVTDLQKLCVFFWGEGRELFVENGMDFGSYRGNPQYSATKLQNPPESHWWHWLFVTVVSGRQLALENSLEKWAKS